MAFAGSDGPAKIAVWAVAACRGVGTKVSECDFSGNLFVPPLSASHGLICSDNRLGLHAGEGNPGASR